MGDLNASLVFFLISSLDLPRLASCSLKNLAFARLCWGVCAWEEKRRVSTLGTEVWAVGLFVPKGQRNSPLWTDDLWEGGKHKQWQRQMYQRELTVAPISSVEEDSTQEGVWTGLVPQSNCVWGRVVDIPKGRRLGTDHRSAKVKYVHGKMAIWPSQVAPELQDRDRNPGTSCGVRANHRTCGSSGTSARCYCTCYPPLQA